MSIEIRPLSGSLGAEVHGVDLGRLESAEFDAIRTAFLEHHVLAFRDQTLKPAEQVAFGQRWGKLYVHPIIPSLPGHPEIVEIANYGKKRSLTEVWHSDVSFDPTPPMASGLLAVELPAYGGDTLFANQHLAYERLSDGMKAMLGSLRAIHSGAGLGAAAGKSSDWREQGQLHPVVRTHPETGRKALYVSPGFTVAFEDMTIAESQPLLQFLHKCCHSLDVCYRHRWLLGDLVLWDNRSVQHHAVHDHGDATRTLHRITVVGDEPK
jgi:taurine dioxygenase